MDSWQLLPRPERLTELYFTDHSALHGRTVPGAKQSVNFTVHNIEHRTTRYRYILTAAGEKEKTSHEVGSGSLTLSHNHSQMVSKEITPPALSGRVAIKVALEYEGIAFGSRHPSRQLQSIHYWTVSTDKPDKDGGGHGGI